MTPSFPTRRSSAPIRRALEKGDAAEFEDTDLYARVFALAEAAEGKPLPRAVLPGIRLESPKITRKLTTAWFANRVNDRWKRCMARRCDGEADADREREDARRRAVPSQRRGDPGRPGRGARRAGAAQDRKGTR